MGWLIVVSLTSKGSLKLQIDGLSNRSNISKDWVFYSFPKPLQILSNPEDETTIRVLKEDKSIPIANDQTARINSLYKSCFLYARIYTEESNATNLLKGIKEWLGV